MEVAIQTRLIQNKKQECISRPSRSVFISITRRDQKIPGLVLILTNFIGYQYKHLISFKVLSFHTYTPMPAIRPLLETFFVRIFRNVLQMLRRIHLNRLDVFKSLPLQHRLQLREEPEITGI
jgi:hypothetical protein